MGSLEQRSSTGRAYSTPPDSLAACKGPTSKGRGKEKRRVEKRSLPSQSSPHIDGSVPDH